MITIIEVTIVIVLGSTIAFSGASVTCNMTFETDLFMAKMRSHLSFKHSKLCARDNRNGLGSRFRY